MRTFTKEYTVYNFMELSDEAKEKAKGEYYERFGDVITDDFYGYVKSSLEDDFPNSKFDVQFRLTYCQGDGLNIYGSVDIEDFINYSKGRTEQKYTDKEYRALQFYSRYYNRVYFSENKQYGYSCKFLDLKYMDDDVSEWVENMRNDSIKNINEELIALFIGDIYESFEALDALYEREGYKMLYEISDVDFADIADANEWELYEDGQFS